MDPAPFFNGAVLSAHRNVVVAPFTELRMKSGIPLHSFEAKQTTMSEKRSTSGPCVKYFSSSSCCPSKPASPAYKIQSLKEAIDYLLSDSPDLAHVRPHRFFEAALQQPLHRQSRKLATRSASLPSVHQMNYAVCANSTSQCCAHLPARRALPLSAEPSFPRAAPTNEISETPDATSETPHPALPAARGLFPAFRPQTPASDAAQRTSSAILTTLAVHQQLRAIVANSGGCSSSKNDFRQGQYCVGPRQTARPVRLCSSAGQSTHIVQQAVDDDDALSPW